VRGAVQRRADHGAARPDERPERGEESVAVGNVLDDFERQRRVEALIRSGELVGGGDPVIDLQPARRGMRARHVDGWAGRVNARYGEAKPRHRFAHQPAAAANIDKPKPLEWPKVPGIAAEARQQLAPDELEPDRI
jgi:hypothetical protein